MVAQDFANLGYRFPDDKTGVTNATQKIEDVLSPVTDNWDEPTEDQMRECQEYMDSYDQTVFKSRGLIYFGDYNGIKVGHYRHPYQWMSAIRAKGKNRDYDWWIEFHTRLLDIDTDYLFNFTDYYWPFGNSSYDPSRVRSREIQDAPEDVMKLYNELERKRG